MSSTPVALRREQPLTPFQRRIWASQRLAPTSPLHNMALVSHLDGPIDPARFVEAFAGTVAAHESLRTRIDTRGAEPVAVLTHDDAFTAVVALDRSAVEAWAAARVSTPIDATHRPYDSVLLTHPDGTATWYLAIHHVITDATSSARIFGATAAAYEGAPVIEPPSYRQWARSLERDENPRRTAARAWWDACEFPAPIGRLYRSVVRPTPSSRRRSLDLGPSLRSALDEALSGPYRLLSADLSWTALVAAVTAATMTRVADVDEVTIGVPVHNRSSAGTRDLVGLVMEVFPLAVAVHADDTFASLHRRVAKDLLAMLRYALPGTAPAVEVDAVVNVIPAAAPATSAAPRRRPSGCTPGRVTRGICSGSR